MYFSIHICNTVKKQVRGQPCLSSTSVHRPVGLEWGLRAGGHEQLTVTRQRLNHPQLLKHLPRNRWENFDAKILHSSM